MSSHARSRVPRWLTITVGALAVLFVLGAIFGAKAPKNTTQAVPAVAPSTTSAPPADPSYTVTKVVDVATAELTDDQGTVRTVRLASLKAPTACFVPESSDWATTFLAGRKVTVRTAASTEALVLDGGTDYATQALTGGYARYVASAGDAALQAAEDSAHATVAGLWAAPCNGNIDVPAVTPPSVATADPVTTAAAPPVVQRTIVPSTKAPATHAAPPAAPQPVAYYPNCAAARAAGVTPLHRGDPGYSAKLDRDGDGIACE